MRKELIVTALVSLAILAVYYSAEENKTSAFDEWKAQYGANWSGEEEAFRRLIFEKNLKNIEKHNADPSQTYKMGVNQFTVYTTEEFVNTYLNPMIAQSKVPEYTEEDIETVNTIGDVDWTTQGKVSKIKNQGQCGSCWAFSATGVMESWALFKGQNVDLSEQQLVDCSRPQGNQGCNGGWPSSALKYVIANGIASGSEYPYVGKDQTCKKNGGSFKIGGQTSFASCNGLSSGINSHPISVTVDASNWSTYRSGVFTNCRTGINHAVLLVGVVGGNWKIKNSWGAGWGESGFIRLGPGNTCGVCSNAGIYPQ